jgi:hypothetical protein
VKVQANFKTEKMKGRLIKAEIAARINQNVSDFFMREQ